MKDDYKVTGSRWRREGGYLCACGASGIWRWDLFVKVYPDRPYHAAYYCNVCAKQRKDNESRD